MQIQYIALVERAFNGYHRNESQAIVLCEQLQASCEQKAATPRISQGRLPRFGARYPGRDSALLDIRRRGWKSLYPAFENFEVEELILYPSVEEKLKKLKVNYITGYKPDSMPSKQI